MTGHLSIPSLEPDPNTPATLSKNVLTGVLRDELHFQGLVVTDAMDMGGITTRFAPGEAAVRAVLAGADALLMSPVPDAAFEALQAAVKSGRISHERLDASVRRILQAKARLGLNKTRLVDINAINEKFGRAPWQKEAQEISDRGVTLLRDTAQASAAGCQPNLPAHCCWRFTRIRSPIPAKIWSANCARVLIPSRPCAPIRALSKPAR